MRNLNFELKQMGERNRDGSFATQADRARMLSLFANQLRELGFPHMEAHSLRTKHVEALLERWTREGISNGTMKNRLSVLRWWAEKVGKQNVVKVKNADYGIERRVLVSNDSKATSLNQSQLATITDVYTKASLMLVAAFGLRREESIKIIPTQADRGDVLHLQASWTKGGKERTIPILTADQRAALDCARQVAGQYSLIPTGQSYRDQLHRFCHQCARAGISHVHGLRHQYAQQRYLTLTGQPCPTAGGPTRRQLHGDMLIRDQEARRMISEEMGHSRAQITAVYCGR